MSDKHDTDGATALDPASVSNVASESNPEGAAAVRPGFVRRYRLPLTLGVVAGCLYAGSILYILFGRGQIA